MYGIYHHRDLDGLCSGAIMKLKYPNIELIGYDYGEPFDIKRYIDQEVIMADVSLPFQINAAQITDMISLSTITKNLVWIDHHISAIKDFEKIFTNKKPFVAVLDNTISACEGTWKYLFPNKQMPDLVYLLGKYDTWRQKNSHTPSGQPVSWDTTLKYQMGMRMKENYNIDWIVGHLSLDATEQEISNQMILGTGATVLEYQAGISKEQCRMFSFEAEFEGLRAICLNGGGFNSQTFDSVWDENKYDVMIPFIYNGKHWKFSLYTTKDIDLSLIAKKHGGGGHTKACGFQKEDITEVFPQLKYERV